MRNNKSRPNPSLQPPKAAVKPQRTTHHDIELSDAYAWLRADNWQQVMRDPELLDPEIRSYLEAENNFTQHHLSDTEQLQERLYQEMRGRIKENDSTVPANDGAYAYFADFIPGGQYPRLMRQARNGGGNTQVLLDGNQRSRWQSLLGPWRDQP